jgi:aminopeptidase YwaD
MTTAVPAVVADVTADRLVATVTELAADAYAGRRVGTAGGRAAGEWLAAQLADLGAAVALQEFPVPEVRELHATPTMCWRGKELRHRRDFVEHLSSADLPTTRTGLLAGQGEPWRGRWVLAAAAEPELISRAIVEQALGVLLPRGTDVDGWMPKMLTGPPRQPIPMAWVRTDLHAELVAEGGEVTASMPLRPVPATGVNIHGVLSDGAPAVLLTAHYDGVGDDPQQRLPAAADNASGVAVVLEAARLLAPILPAGIGLSVTLLDAEEAGAHGSLHHAPLLAAGTQVINIDGVAQLNESAAVEAGGPAHGLLAALDQAGRQVGVALRAGAMASDNRRYAAAGLAAIGIGMGIPGYQSPAETPDRVETATLIAATRLVVATVHQLIHTLGEKENDHV